MTRAQVERGVTVAVAVAYVGFLTLVAAFWVLVAVVLYKLAGTL